MRDTIETAPKDGEVVILEDDASGTYDIARWSPEAGGWVVGENAEPIKITPSHWYPLQGDNHLQQGDGLSSSVSEASTSASRFHSFLLRRAATLRRDPEQQRRQRDVQQKEIHPGQPRFREAF